MERARGAGRRAPVGEKQSSPRQWKHRDPGCKGAEGWSGILQLTLPWEVPARGRDRAARTGLPWPTVTV